MSRFNLCLFLLLFFVCSFCLKPFLQTYAAYSTNNTAGIYTDDFANTSGTSSRVGVGVSGGLFKLSNGSSGFSAPFFSTGNFVTRTISVFSISKWNTIDIAATTPAGTSVKVQVLDDANVPYSDTFLPNNSVGNSNFPLDISGVPPLYISLNANKPQEIRLKFILDTNDTGITPSVNSMTLTWTVRQGDTTTSLFDSDADWPIAGGDRQNTYHTSNFNSATYPTFGWVTNRIMDSFMPGEIYVTDDKIVSFNAVPEGYLTGVNKIDGSISWNIPFIRCAGPMFAFTQNGSFFGHEYGCDLMYAFDSSNGMIKWGNNFYGGHSNNDTAIGNDGTIYEIRNGSVGLGMTLYAFNQGGTVKWTKDIIQESRVGDTAIMASFFAMSPDASTIYFPTSTQNSEYDSTKHAELYAVSTTDGSVLWHHLIPDSSDLPVVGSDGTIYLGSSQYSSGENVSKNLIAYNSDGSVKWTTDRTADTSPGFSSSRNGFSLRSDGVLLTSRYNSDYDIVLNAFNTTNGVQLWESNPVTGRILFSDGQNGFYFNDSTYASGVSTRYLNYFGANYQQKWRLANTYISTDGLNHQSYSISSLSPGSNGMLYGSFARSYYDSSYNELYGEGYTRYFSLKPWTLTHTNNIGSTILPGASISFTATTSMGTTNPLFGGDNQVQIYFDNGSTFPLTFGSTDAFGNTVWLGSYTLPGSFPAGTHTYTVEASQAHLQTDIPTHFSSASLESNNTGIGLTQSFTVSRFNQSLGVGSSINTQSLVDSGLLSLSAGDSLSSTNTITVNNDLDFEVGGHDVLLPSGSIISAVSEQPFNAALLSGSTLPTSNLTSVFPDTAIMAAFQWGIPDLGLKFTTPITVTINVGSQYNGQTLSILRSVDGSSNWTSDGIVNQNTCYITNGNCTFQTTKASYFVTKAQNSTASNSNTSVNTPPAPSQSCNGDKPVSAPSLFQSNVNNTTAKLFFTPIANTNHYLISFSTKPTADDYSVEVDLAREGIQNYTVEQLKPSTTYYFKIRGQNGCTPGDWSNTFKVTTKSKSVTKSTSVYLKNQPKAVTSPSLLKKATTVLKKLTTKMTTSKTKTITPPADTLLNPQVSTQTISPSSQTTPQTPTQTPVTPKKKTCILWWCF